MLCALAAALSCACSDSTDVPGPTPEPGKKMTFKFNIYTGGDTPTRALGVWEEDAANAAERILNISDMRVLIFYQSGYLMKSVTPHTLDYEGNPGDNDGYYTLTVSFSSEYFDNFDSSVEIPFRVMVLANMNGVGGLYNSYPEETTTINGINEWFAMKPDYYPSEKCGIPMYGLSEVFRVKKELMDAPSDVITAGDINMLRSLCKIEVTDEIVNKAPDFDGEYYPKVTGVRAESWTDHAYLKPSPFVSDYTQGLYTANIYKGALCSHPLEARKEEDGCFRLYCPESEIGDMLFTVTVQTEPGGPEKEFTTGISQFSKEIGNELVRNHIYRFRVHAVDTRAELTASVSDWDVVTGEYELDNTVTLDSDGFFHWEWDGDDFSYTKEDFGGEEEWQLSIFNSTRRAATGRFHISSPAGATWKAYFIPGENGVDAFEFIDVDESGNEVPGSASVYAEGEVGKPAAIHIRGKGDADSFRHWAELVVEVHTIDGTILLAPLTEEMHRRIVIFRDRQR